MFKKLLLTLSLLIFGFGSSVAAQTVVGADGNYIYWNSNSGQIQKTPIGIGPTNINQYAGSGASQNNIVFSQNCNIQPKCYQIKGDGQFVTDAGFIASSTTVTTGESDPPFASSDVGKTEFGTYNCAPGNEGACFYNCPQGIITSVINAHTVTISQACVHNSSAGNSDNFIWGTDDASVLGTGVAAAMATYASGNATTIQLPCAVILMGAPAFQFDTFRTNPSRNAVGMRGCGSGSPTVIVPLPKMNCDNGTGGSKHGCLISDNYEQNALANTSIADSFEDIMFWGGGTDDKDSSADYRSGNSGIYLPFFALAKNVWVQGWVWNRDQATPMYGFTCNGCTMVNSGSYAGGNYACLLISDTPVVANAHGGSCGGSEYNSVTANEGEAATYGVYINAPTCGNYMHYYCYGVHAIGSGVLYQDFGSFMGLGIWNDSNATSKLFGSDLEGGSGGFSTYDFVLAGGSLYLNNVLMPENAVQTGGNLYDVGGNQFPVTGFTHTGGNVFGSSSITGAVQTTGNVALTSGWDTSTVTTASGDSRHEQFTVTFAGSPSSSNVVTITFPTPFWIAPLCVLSDVGGTGALPTSIVNGSITNTNAAFTVNGTFTTGTEIFHLSCEN